MLCDAFVSKQSNSSRVAFPLASTNMNQSGKSPFLPKLYDACVSKQSNSLIMASPLASKTIFLLQVCGCGEEDCLDGNQIWLTIGEHGVERLNLSWGHHKNSARTSKPIPPVMLPLGDDLTKVLTWWIKVGHFKLKQGTMVSDDEVR
jgi:hypothetical protein